MAALEFRILTKLLKERSLLAATKAGLTEEHFKDHDARKIFKCLQAHWYDPNTSRTLPTIAYIKRTWPSFELTAVGNDEGDGALRALMQELKIMSFETDTRAMANYFQELADADPYEAVKTMQAGLSKLRGLLEGKARHMGVKDLAEHAKHHYGLAKSGDIYGIPWPWDCVTDDTLGKRAGDFIYLYGRMKSMKCICAGQRIVTPDGKMVPIEELPESTVAPSYTESSGRIRFAAARRVVSGVKDCVEVTTESGLKLKTSKEHLYMVPTGYERICNLQPGDLVAASKDLESRTWEKITSIEEIGERPCYDICIEDGQDPNFVVEGFIVHNTWVMLKSAMNDFELGYRPLIWSKEMDRDKMALRIASIMARVDYQLFKKGMLPPHLERKAIASLEDLVENSPAFADTREKVRDAKDIMILAGRDAPRHFNDLKDAIHTFNPDIVYLDSFYHMDTERSEKSSQRWAKITALSEDINEAADDFGIPIMAVGQANRTGEKTHGETMVDLADADAIGREATLVCRITKKKGGKELYEEDYEQPTRKKKSTKLGSIARRRNLKKANSEKEEEKAPRYGAELAIAFGGNREGVLEAITIHAVPGYNFNLIESNFSTEDIGNWANNKSSSPGNGKNGEASYDPSKLVTSWRPS